ncbi:MAG TPA: GAF domain-containing protein [Roseiflexaceae bacterium]|nr:GAF domain-containing protein [Roseiflexaceae bacterium]HMP39566.1 GAF domain-containing protein [Roseiflexaceae bacterium]
MPTSSYDTDQLQLLQQFSSDLSQAQSLAAGAAICCVLLDRYASPRQRQVAWGYSSGRQPFLPSAPPEELLLVPDPESIALLESGDLAFEHRDEHTRYYAPLRLSGVLAGWIMVEDPAWSTDGPAFLAVVAAHGAPLFHMLSVTQQHADRERQLNALTEISQLFSEVLDLDQLLDTIYRLVNQFFTQPNFYIALQDEASQTFELVYLVAYGERQRAEQRWSFSSGLAGLVIQRRSPIVTSNYRAECERRGVVPQMLGGLPTAEAWLGVPLIARDRILGIMTVSSTTSGTIYSPVQIELFTMLAGQAAVALDNAYLYQRSERQARELAALNRIGRTITSSLDPDLVPSIIMEQVTELLEAEEGSLLLNDPSGDLVFAYTTGPYGQQLLGRRLPQGTGIAGYVVEHGRSVIVNDAQQDHRFDGSTDESTGFVTRSLLATPLRGVGGVQGVIEVLNRRDRSPFDSDDQRLLEAVADYAVIALENAQRFAQIDKALTRRAQELARTNEQLQHNLRSLTALNALGMAINTSLLSVDEIFRMTSRGVVDMTSALGAAVLLVQGDGFNTLITIGSRTVELDQTLIAHVRTALATGRPEGLQGNLAPELTASGIASILIVPLRATQRTLGCLVVYYGHTLPDASDREMVALFATQAASAVESVELFSVVRSARDEMASILASTREGIMLIAANGTISIANGALFQLCELPRAAIDGMPIAEFVATWRQSGSYTPEAWDLFEHGIAQVSNRHEIFATGELSPTGGRRHLEWTVLTVQRSGNSHGGALVMLRDITEAKEAERLRHDLTHMIVHDLRSPLSNVMASIDLLTKGVSGELNKEQLNILSIAGTSAVQMLDMINMLLDISRLEAGRMPLNLAIRNPADLIAHATRQLAALATDRKIVIQHDIAPDLPQLMLDGNLVTRVLQNLLANALKFSGRNSIVLVRAFTSDLHGHERQNGSPPAAVTIAVSDRGVGIAPQDLDKIFTKFGQVGERRGGSGLGLTFCKLAIEAHGGMIWVESSPGNGSTFFFCVPT